MKNYDNFKIFAVRNKTKPNQTKNKKYRNQTSEIAHIRYCFDKTFFKNSILLLLFFAFFFLAIRFTKTIKNKTKQQKSAMNKSVSGNKIRKKFIKREAHQ